MPVALPIYCTYIFSEWLRESASGTTAQSIYPCCELFTQQCQRHNRLQHLYWKCVPPCGQQVQGSQPTGTRPQTAHRYMVPDGQQVQGHDNQQVQSPRLPKGTGPYSQQVRAPDGQQVRGPRRHTGTRPQAAIRYKAMTASMYEAPDNLLSSAVVFGATGMCPQTGQAQGLRVQGPIRHKL